MDKFECKAYAKINLGLDILGKLENGYHEVKMIMQTVGIYDELTFEKTPNGIILEIENSDLPCDGNNLIFKAARLLFDLYGISEGIKVTLKKHIPVAAGMAGGSTDAAATMIAVNKLFNLNLPKEKLMEHAVKIGADVPYCICGGTALAEGIGEKLTPLPKAPNCFLVVAKPDFGVSTKYVYETFDKEKNIIHPDIDGMIKQIELGNLQGIADRISNVLEFVTAREHKEIDLIKKEMLDNGAIGALMSGSGPTVFGIFTDKDKAKKAYEIINEKKLAPETFVTEFV